MKMKQAMSVLRAAYPGRNVFIEKTHRHYSVDRDGEAPTVRYRVSVLPGWDGSDCTSASHADLQAAVDVALSHSYVYCADQIVSTTPLDRPNVRSRDEEAAHIAARGKAEMEVSADRPVNLEG